MICTKASLLAWLRSCRIRRRRDFTIVRSSSFKINTSNEEIKRFLNATRKDNFVILRSGVAGLFNKRAIFHRSKFAVETYFWHDEIQDHTTRAAAMCSMDLFPTENLPWPQNVYFIQCNLSKKKISGRKAKGFCRGIFSPIPVNVELTSQLKFDPALNAKRFRLCKFRSRLNFIWHKIAMFIW